MTYSFIRIASFVALVLAVFALVNFSAEMYRADAATPPGLKADIATSSRVAVGTTVALLSATSTNCSARIVSTGGSAVRLGFTNKFGTTTNGTTGLEQAASTTVAYDASIYGCDSVTAYSYATAFINFYETR